MPNSAMKADEWIRDPVFQLNLLVWMSKEQPEGAYCVRPIFNRAGFEWMAIETPFPFPIETVKRIAELIESGKLRVHANPEPELVLKRGRDRKALYFEAKANSHGADSSTASQARGHLLAVGPVFSEVSAPLEKALLVYVLPNESSSLMRECLQELSDQLRIVDLIPGDSCVDGLSAGDTAIHYHFDGMSRELLGIADPSIEVIRDIEPNTDPSPLLLIYTDEDCPNQERQGHYRKVLQNQCIATLLCELHRLDVGQPVTLTAARILELTTQGAFQFLGQERRKRMELLLKVNVFNRIGDHWKDRVPDAIKVQGKELTVLFPSEVFREDFLDWLERGRTVFSDDAPSGTAIEQMDLGLPTE